MSKIFPNLMALFAVALLVASAANAAEVRLDGINILGSSKSAYLSVDGHASRFREGDTMNGWTLERVLPRSVELRTPTGELRVLTLHGAGDTDSTAVAKPVAKKRVAKEKATEVSKPVLPPGSNYAPRVIDDRDVPPGYAKVRTPFGDVLVDKAKQKGTLLDR